MLSKSGSAQWIPKRNPNKNPPAKRTPLFRRSACQRCARTGGGVLGKMVPLLHLCTPKVQWVGASFCKQNGNPWHDLPIFLETMFGTTEHAPRKLCRSDAKVTNWPLPLTHRQRTLAFSSQGWWESPRELIQFCREQRGLDLPLLLYVTICYYYNDHYCILLP